MTGPRRYRSTPSAPGVAEGAGVPPGANEAADGAGSDPVNAPPHYRSHPSGIEVIEITKHMDFCLGNVLKYVLRADHKGKPIEDLLKARRYLDYAIEMREQK